MRTPSRLNLAVTGLVLAVGAAASIAWVWARGDQAPTATELRIIRHDNGPGLHAASVTPTNLIPDFF